MHRILRTLGKSWIQDTANDNNSSMSHVLRSNVQFISTLYATINRQSETISKPINKSNMTKPYRAGWNLEKPFMASRAIFHRLLLLTLLFTIVIEINWDEKGRSGTSMLLLLIKHFMISRISYQMIILLTHLKIR